MKCHCLQTVPLPAGSTSVLAKPTKYHYYPHNQHIYLLPECAIQQVMKFLHPEKYFIRVPIICSVSYSYLNRRTINIHRSFHTNGIILCFYCIDSVFRIPLLSWHDIVQIEIINRRIQPFTIWFCESRHKSKYDWTEQNIKYPGSQSKGFLDTCSAVSASSDSSQRSRVRFPLPLLDFFNF